MVFVLSENICVMVDMEMMSDAVSQVEEIYNVVSLFWFMLIFV